jgi:hypothetical protein
MTTKLRETIRTMVRNEFTTRILAEAEGKAEKIYRHSNYVASWTKLPNGKAGNEPSDKPSKHDFVRWFLKQYLNSPNSTLNLSSEYLGKAKNLLMPLAGKPDEFIEAMNKDRELVFGQSYSDNPGSNFRSGLTDSTDPVAKFVENYLAFKSMRGHLAKQTWLDDVHLDDEEDDGTEKGAGYDVDPGATTKVNIAKMLSQDPTETTTEMSVVNRVKSGKKHLSNEKTKEILAFLQDPDMVKSDKTSILSDLDVINKLANDGLSRYSTMFVDSMIEASKAAKSVEDFEEVDKVRGVGIKKFIAKLKTAGTFSKTVNKNTWNPAEGAVFDAALDADVGRYTVAQLVMIAAKKPESYELFRDEAIATAIEIFGEEMTKQTNFNTVGDFTDTLPRVKEVRQSLFKTLEKRGRKAGSTKEVLAAKKLAK